MMSTVKRIGVVLAAGAMVIALSACSFTEPCESCGDKPTRGNKNNYYDEREYYCRDCASDCAFCSGRATEHYTSGLGCIIFACDDCYEEIESYNS